MTGMIVNKQALFRFLVFTLIYIAGVATLVLFLQRYDALLISYLVPIVWAAYLYPRWVYLAITGVATTTAVMVLYALFDSPTRSLYTLAVAIVTALALSEVLHYLIARQRRLEARLRDAEEKFRHLVDNMDQAFWLQRPGEPGFSYVSPAHERVWGSMSEYFRSNRASLVETVVAEDRDRARKFLGRLAAEKAEVEYRLPDGPGKVRWVRERAFPVKNEEGACSIIAGIAEDITERTLLAARFQQAQKIESVGRMSCALAHDLNNILTVIQGQVDLIEFEGDRGSPEALGEIRASVERAENLTRQLLASARKRELAPKVLDLNEVVLTAMKLLRRTVDETVVLTLDTAPLPLPVFADRASIEQVLLNLVINARDAMPHGGCIRISTGLTTIAPEERERPGSESRAVLTVKDSGHGIEKQNLEQIFEPFFTTRPMGKGTGLGLSTVDSIVRQHGGKVKVASEVGKGSAFEVLLPISEEALEVPAAVPKLPVEAGEGTILVVEDDPFVREVTRSFLARLGYQVLEARTGVSALSIWTHCQGRIDLLITDMVLPDGMSGEDLARELTQDKPSLKIVFTTGYTGERTHPEIAPGARVVRKPYDLKTLARTLGELITERPAAKTHPAGQRAERASHGK